MEYQDKVTRSTAVKYMKLIMPENTPNLPRIGKKLIIAPIGKVFHTVEQIDKGYFLFNFNLTF